MRVYAPVLQLAKKTSTHSVLHPCLNCLGTYPANVEMPQNQHNTKLFTYEIAPRHTHKFTGLILGVTSHLYLSLCQHILHPTMLSVLLRSHWSFSWVNPHTIYNWFQLAVFRHFLLSVPQWDNEEIALSCCHIT